MRANMPDVVRGWRMAAMVLLVVIASAPPAPAAAGWISGPYRGLHPRLKVHLHRLHRVFGRPVRVMPHGGCRRHGSRRAPRSFHRIAAGCKAADIVMPGVSGRRILAWWGRHVGGGRGYYCGHAFVHVDIGPPRTWRWYCGQRLAGRRHGRRRRRARR
ncbi:MAG TPA: DUF882 domain-containing protein [Thermopetrobacter sp.]|nr:DUF882 domain-containing protein [Thermopetrobacter sp.]